MDSSTFEYALRLPNSLFATNREKFFSAFKKKVPDVEKSLLLFKGQDDLPVDDTDIDYEVRQESFFYYLFGVQENGCSAAIDITEEKVILFFPKFDEIYKLWMKVMSLEELQEIYPDLEIRYIDEMEEFIKDYSPTQIFINKGVNSDSGSDTIVPQFKWLEEYKVDNELMHPILSECRVTKNPEEINILEVANKISSEAHCWVMKNCKPGVRESYLESKFKAYCTENYNCRIVPYASICACGPNPSTLHYIVNSDILPENTMCLMDMGHQVHCYGADITCCYPTNGKFTEKQANIHNLVVKANRTVMNQMKPGVNWRDMHLLAEKVILEGLKEIGIIKADVDLEEALNERVGFAFQPHGLGHLIGLDTHDVGGYLPHTPLRSSKWGLKNLRTARDLEENMVITVEPGCYFIPSILQERSVDIGIDIDKYVNLDLAMEYRKEVAGVRIEDCVQVTADGVKNLTKVPRTIDQIEACMKGDDWTELPEFEL